MKHASAITTALIITAIIGLGIMVIGVSAFTNKNTVPLQNSPNASQAGTSANTNANSSQSSASTPAQVQQLQQQVTDLQNSTGPGKPDGRPIPESFIGTAAKRGNFHRFERKYLPAPRHLRFVTLNLNIIDKS